MENIITGLGVFLGILLIFIVMLLLKILCMCLQLRSNRKSVCAVRIEETSDDQLSDSLLPQRKLESCRENESTRIVSADKESDPEDNKKFSGNCAGDYPNEVERVDKNVCQELSSTSTAGKQQFGSVTVSSVLSMQIPTDSTEIQYLHADVHEVESDDHIYDEATDEHMHDLKPASGSEVVLRHSSMILSHKQASNSPSIQEPISPLVESASVGQLMLKDNNPCGEYLYSLLDENLSTGQNRSSSTSVRRVSYLTAEAPKADFNHPGIDCGTELLNAERTADIVIENNLSNESGEAVLNVHNQGLGVHGSNVADDKKSAKPAVPPKAKVLTGHEIRQFIEQQETETFMSTMSRRRHCYENVKLLKDHVSYSHGNREERKEMMKLLCHERRPSLNHFNSVLSDE